MLQRQIMFKQLQEMQRRQQLQDLGNTRNQNYVNQLSSLRQPSGGQLSPKDNGIPAQDSSQMFRVGNMQMMQHGLGLAQPQFDVSSYGTHSLDSDKNFIQYPQLQAPPNLSVNPLTKNTNSPLGMTAPGFGSSFNQCNFSFDHSSMQDGSFLSNHETSLFGQVPVEGFNSGALSGIYPQQGITIQRNASLLDSEERRHDGATVWRGLSPGKTLNFGPSQTAASLDPLEEKILYDTDDNSSWSALMQSAVAETSSNDPGIQEEWSGLSFQNPEPLNDKNQQRNFMDSEKLQNNWVDRNLQNASSSPSSRPEQLYQNFNTGFTNFQQLGHQYPKEKEEYHSPRNTSQLADYISQQKRTTGGSQMIQTSLPSTNIWSDQDKDHSDNDAHGTNFLSCNNDDQSCNNFSSHEFRGTSWLHGSGGTPHHVPGGNQKPYDQVNHLNIHEYAVEPENMAPGENVGAASTLFGASLKRHGESMAPPSERMLELLNKDDISNDTMAPMQLNSKVSIPRESPLSETSVASFAKPCSPSPASPDFGFRLGPADPRVPQSPDFGFRLGPADPRVPQSYSFFPSLSMGTSGAASLSSRNMSDLKNQSPTPTFQSGVATTFPAYGAAAPQDNSKPKTTHSRLAVSGHDTSSAGSYEHNNENSFRHEYNVQELSKYSGKSDGHEQRLDKGSLVHEDLTDINNLTSPSRNTRKQEIMRNHSLEAEDVGSGSVMTNTHQKPSNQVEGGRERETPSFPSGNSGVVHHSLNQNYPLLNQVQSTRNTESDVGKNSSPNYDNIDYHQSIQNARELFSGEQNSGVKDGAKSDLSAVSQIGAFQSGGSTGWNVSQEALVDQSGKPSSFSYHQNLQQMNMFGQNDTRSRFFGGNNEASNLTYQSQINLQMAPSWFKHHGNLINGQILPMHDPRVATKAAQPLSEMTLGNSQENSLLMHVHLAKASQGSGLYPSTTATSIACKQLNPTSVFPSDVTCQNLAVSIPKKRKLVALDMLPWHKEVNHKQSRLQDISTAELEWAEASNRRQEEVKNGAGSVDELPPVIRAKRRLICTTHLMQQVFRPAPAVILWSDASSNCEYVAYSAARLALGEACSLTCRLSYETTNISSDKLTTSKRPTACKFSKVVEGYINRVKQLEGDLSRGEKCLTFVDINLEAQELEKFSIINRFAKFHVKAHLSTSDVASSSGIPTLNKANLQRYVSAVPMPRIVPEATDCLSL